MQAEVARLRAWKGASPMGRYGRKPGGKKREKAVENHVPVCHRAGLRAVNA